MGVARSILIDQITQVLQEPLQNLGFAFEASPPNSISYDFWFEKQSQAVADMFVIIDFQPSGFGVDDLFDLAINLHRRLAREGLSEDAPKDKPAEIWAVRLAPCLWDDSGQGAVDYWWHFVSVAALQVACHDMLDKIIRFGIPFLENPDSTWFTALPNHLRRRSRKN